MMDMWGSIRKRDRSKEDRRQQTADLESKIYVTEAILELSVKQLQNEQQQTRDILSQLSKSIDELGKKLADGNKANYGLWISFGTLVFIVCSALGTAFLGIPLGEAKDKITANANEMIENRLEIAKIQERIFYLEMNAYQGQDNSFRNGRPVKR